MLRNEVLRLVAFVVFECNFSATQVHEETEGFRMKTKNKSFLISPCILLTLVLSYMLHYYGTLDFSVGSYPLKPLKTLGFW